MFQLETLKCMFAFLQVSLRLISSFDILIAKLLIIHDFTKKSGNWSFKEQIQLVCALECCE